MSNTISLDEPLVDTLIAQGWTGLQLERGVSATNLASFRIIVQIPYVAGQTAYLYDDLTGAISDWYRVVRYARGGALGTYSQPWPVRPPSISSGDGARRSLKNCRRMLARKMTSLQVATATADGKPDGSSLISTGLANQLDSNRYRMWWVMPTDGVNSGQIRMVAENALNPTTGELNVSPPMLTQILSGTQVELHKLLPPDDDVGPILGLRQALNLALAECWVLDRLAVASTGAVTYDVESLGDWLDPEAVYEFYGPAIGGIPLMPFGGYGARRDAEQVNIDVIGLAAGTSASLELTRPGDTYMKVGGIWTDNQQGFVNDDDECLFQPAFLSEIAMAHCYEALANATTTGPNQTRYQALADRHRAKANVMKLRHLPHPPERSHGVYTGSGSDWLGWLR